MVIEQSNVDFGLVRLGEAGQTVITIHNTCRVPAKWSLREAETHADVSKREPWYGMCNDGGEVSVTRINKMESTVGNV